MNSQRLAAILLAPLILSQCAPSRSTPEPVRIAVAMTPLSTAFFVAETSGYFQQCGLDPELVPVNGGKRAFDLLNAGDVDFSTSSDSVVSYAVMEGNQPFDILASFASSENDIKLISRRPDAIPEGGQVGFWGASSSEHLLQTYLNLYAPEQQINRLNAPPETLVDMFRAKQVDAISVWEPYAWQLADLIDSEEAYLLDTAALHSLHFLLLSRTDNGTDPEIAERLLAALQLATITIHKDPETVQLDIRNRMSTDQSFIDWIWDDYLFQVKPATSIRYALLSNSRWFSDSQTLNYQPYLARAENLPNLVTLTTRWCQS